MHVNIILVNWKRAIDTCDCIESIRRVSNVSWYLTVCDNGSQDGSFVYIRDYLSRYYIERKRECHGLVEVFDYFEHNDNMFSAPIVSFVVSSVNTGFSGGNNIALNAIYQGVEVDYFWFLNNDTEINQDTLSYMIERMQEDKKIGICGSTLVYAHDRQTVQAFGGAEYSRWTGAVTEIGNGKSHLFSVDREDIESRMDYVSGASMLISKNFIDDVGPLSEDYFLYYEEIDWAERGRRAGYRLGYAPNSIVYHKEGSVLGSGKSKGRSLLAEYFGIRNRLIFTRKFFPWALPSVFCFSLLQVLRRCTQGRWIHARLMASVLLGIRKAPPR